MYIYAPHISGVIIREFVSQALILTPSRFEIFYQNILYLMFQLNKKLLFNYNLNKKLFLITDYKIRE